MRATISDLDNVSKGQFRSRIVPFQAKMSWSSFENEIRRHPLRHRGPTQRGRNAEGNTPKNRASRRFKIDNLACSQTNHQWSALRWRVRSGRKSTVVPLGLVKVVGDRMRRNPRRTCRKLAADLNVSKSSIANLVKNNKGQWPFKRRTAQMLKPAQNKTGPSDARTF